MSDCIFCKISNHLIPTDVIFEDEACMVFKDIHPKAKIHLLLVSKKHINSVAEMIDEDEIIVGHMVNCARIVANKLNLKGYQLQINVGKEGGQEIFHLHLHLLCHL